MSKKRKFVLVFICLVFLLTSIVTGVALMADQPIQAVNYLPASATPTSNPTPTATLEPTATATLAPTATPAPTATATPTATPTPTPIPVPTITPVITVASTRVSFNDRFTFRKSDVVRNIKPGVIHVQRITTGPIRMNILLFDLTAPEINLKVALQDDWLSGVARTSTLAKANNALAGVNGDLFSSNALPQGMTMTDSKLALAPKRRATFAWNKQTGPFIGYFTQNFTWPSNIVAPNGEQYKLDVMNTTCKENWLCVYTDLYRSIGTAAGDIRVTLNASDEVTAIQQEEKVQIPAGYKVLVGKGIAGKWLLNNVKVGQKLEVNFVTDPDYRNFEQIVSGGPVFLRDGNFIQDCLCFLDDCSESKQKEVVCEEFTTDWKLSHYLTVRMPRNAVGFNVDKSVLMVAVVDGYQPNFSIGMTQRELADLFTEFGMTSAMELDGGGSATMYLEGKLVSRPSDGNGSVERMVPNALLFFWSDNTASGGTQTPAPTGGNANKPPAPTPGRTR